MKLHEILNEGTNYPVIVVDVQPAYANAIHFAPQLAEFLNNRTGKVWMMYNGSEDSGTSDDSLQDVYAYWFDMGLGNEDPDEFDRIVRQFKWTDKGYAFFRSWMDSGVSDHTIIRVLREMIQQRVYDSRELFDGDEEKFAEFLGNDFDEMMLGDNLYIPHQLPVNELRQFNGAYICGGGHSECLKEVLIWMSVFNIKYKIMNKFIY